MNLEKPDQAYVDAVKALNAHDIEELDARIRPWLPADARLARMQKLERAALQLQYEEKSVAQWRANLAQLRDDASR